MRFYYRRAAAVLLSAILAVTASVCPAAEAEEPAVFADENTEMLLAGDETDEAAVENWLSVAGEVLVYYAEYSAGLEPLVTERNWRFYDVIADKTIDLNDAAYFLNLYSSFGAGLEFSGYIPERNGEYSPLVPSEGTTTTTPAATTTTSAETTTTSASTTASKTTTASTTASTTVPTISTTPVTTTTSATTTKTGFTENGAGKYIVDATALNMRSGPGTGYSVVVLIPGGATVTVTATGSNNWAVVEYEGYSGYCSMDYLVPASESETTTSATTTKTTTTTTKTTTASKTTTTAKTTTSKTTTTAKTTTTSGKTTTAKTTTTSGKTTTAKTTTTSGKTTTAKTTTTSGKTTTAKTTTMSGKTTTAKTTTTSGKTTTAKTTTTSGKTTTAKTTTMSGKTTTTAKTTTSEPDTAETTTSTTGTSSTWSASTKQTTTTASTTASTAGPTVPTTTSKTTTGTTNTTISGETTASGETAVTETTTVTTTTVITRTPHSWGIDVSVYQGDVDWEAVKESGVDFAIIRAGYGKHINQEDKYFDINMENAKAAGLNCGAYWFSYATTPEAAELEADVFYEVIKDYKFEYPVFFDYETSTQYQLDPEESSEIIHAFCQRIESYGYYVSLCSYVNFLNTRVEPEIFDCFDTWIAHYNVQVPAFERNYGIWQYSCTGEVVGVDAPVDLNYSYFDYPSIIKKNGLNGY